MKFTGNRLKVSTFSFTLIDSNLLNFSFSISVAVLDIHQYHCIRAMLLLLCYKARILLFERNAGRKCIQSDHNDVFLHLHLNHIFQTGLLLSRGSASVLNINCCLILLPVCRFINSYIHLTFSLISRTVLKYWLHNVQNIHVLIALTILIASREYFFLMIFLNHSTKLISSMIAVVHSAGHILNAVNASVHYNHRYPSINWASYQHEVRIHQVTLSQFYESFRQIY